MGREAGQGRAKLPVYSVKQTLATAANGVFTAQISEEATHVALTSGGATEYVVLPKAKADLIGRRIVITVGANGCELVTPSGSGDTVNQVNCDGTNQLDVAANVSLICEQVTATGWTAIQVAATAITVVAPDND